MVREASIYRDHVRTSLKRPELGAPAVCAWTFEQGPLDILELLLCEKRRPPGSFRQPETAHALLFPGMGPGRSTLPRHAQSARHFGRTEALGEHPGDAQPPILQGAAISASRLARTLAG